MSGIKALDKLRESSHVDDNKWMLASGEVVYTCNHGPEDPNAVNWGEQWRKIADEIEREHAQQVSELNSAVCERDGRIRSYERRNTELNDVIKAICMWIGVSTEWGAEDTAKKVIAEFERYYMALPWDADDVPIRPGDKCVFKRGNLCRSGTVVMVGEELVSFGDEFSYHADDIRHVEPRTIEDVLADVWKEALDYAKSDMWRNPDDVFTERADEIRRLMEEECND